MPNVLSATFLMVTRPPSWILGLRVGDLVNHQSHTALRDDVGDTVADLNGDNRRRGIDAEHGEQVHDRVCAPANYSHHLSSLDFALDFWVGFGVRGSRKANEKLIDNVQEEAHGEGPAHPTWCEVTRDDKLTVIARYNHQSSAHPESPSLAAVCLVVKFHHQE